MRGTVPIDTQDEETNNQQNKTKGKRGALKWRMSQTCQKFFTVRPIVLVIVLNKKFKSQYEQTKPISTNFVLPIQRENGNNRFSSFVKCVKKTDEGLKKDHHHFLIYMIHI